MKIFNKYLLILIIVSFSVFSNTIFHDFVWDDIYFIPEDTFIKTMNNPFYFFKPEYWLKYFKGTPGRYRPLRAILFWIEYRLWGVRPQFYHLVNVVLHTIVVVLIFLFLTKWVFMDNKTSFLTSLVFAVYPVHVESVAWVKNCTDLLCMIFYLLSFHFFLKSFYDTKTKILSVIYYFLALICYVISILAKEMGITLPAVIFFYLWIVKKETKLVKNLIKISGYVIPLLAVLVYKIFVLESSAPLTIEISYIIKTFGEYLQILLFPFNLCAERQLNKVESFFEPTLLLGIFGLIIIGLVLYYKKELRFPLLWFLVTILPVLNIIYLEGRPLAEQRLYIPSLGFCMVLGYLFASKLDKNYLTKPLFILLTATYGIVAIDRNYDWQNSLTFWEKTLYQTGSPRAFLNLGEAYLRLGDNELGIRVSKQALRYDPSLVGAMANIGVGYMKLNEKEKALEYFMRALLAQPYDVNNYVNLAVALLELNRLEEAKKILEKGLQVDDRHPLLHYTLGNVYGQLGVFDKAAEHFKLAMTLNPELKIAERNYKQALKDLEAQKKKIMKKQ